MLFTRTHPCRAGSFLFPDAACRGDTLRATMPALATLHMVCGKVAAGKSTLCARLAQSPTTITVNQDVWMSRLYPDELRTIADYIRLVPRLRAAMGDHLSDLLRAGLSVVLDWPANTVASRRWMRGIFEAVGAAHQLHVLDVPDEVCKQRLIARNASGAHEYTVSAAQFDELSRYFEPPTETEGFDIVVHR
jgi:predicted kinase